MTVIVIGDPINGIRIVGAFNTEEDAVTWADRHCEDTDWWTAPLEAPSQWE
jgi:hypothetical protein